MAWKRKSGIVQKLTEFFLLQLQFTKIRDLII